MRRRGTCRARITLVIAGAAFGIGLTAGGAAWAAAPVISADNVYSAGTYTMDQGELLRLSNMGPVNRHDVWSRAAGPDSKKLFISPDINPGQTANVAGTQYLTTGTYPFFCNLHPFEMSGDLQVTANGTPVPRPTFTLKITTTKIDKVVGRGGLLVRIIASAKVDDSSLVAQLGKAQIGSAEDLALTSGTQFIRIKLTKAGKAKLAKKDKAKITVTGTPSFGSPAKAKATLK